MKIWNKKLTIGLVLALVMALGVVMLAMADTITSDGDVLTIGNQSSFDLGTVQPGAIINKEISFQLVCAGKAHVDEAQLVKIDFTNSTFPSGGGLTATSTTIGAIPPEWPDDISGGGNTNCPANPPTLNDNNNSTVTITAPSLPGPYTYVANYVASISPTGNGDPQAITGSVPSVTFTLTVAAPADTTPPVITPNVSGNLGNNDWYVSDVTVSWTVIDPDSTITSTSGCDPTTINADTAGTTLTCTATSAGGTSSESVTIKRDATRPSISGSISPARPASGWWNITSGAPTASFTCSDDTSGLVGACPSGHLFGEGADQSYSETIYDNAGNSASADVSDIDVDLTAPTVALVGGPADGTSYYFGFVPADPTCTASDALSGLDGACSMSGYSAAVGSHTVTASAKDKAGNTASVSANYTVMAWTLNGFYQPVDMDKLNTVKGGSTVPLKFEIFAGPTELTDIDYFESWGYTKINCDPNVALDAIEITATGGTSLRYDTISGQFIFNWQTPKTPGVCFRVTMKTDDGSSISADFKLK